MCFDFRYNSRLITFLIQRKIERDTLIIVNSFSSKISVILVRF